MNFSINSQTPAFKGLYVVNGDGKDLMSYESMMDGLREQGMASYAAVNGYNPEHTSWRFKYAELQPNGEFPRKINYYYLTSLYGEEQHEAKLLVATDEDVKAVKAWKDKYGKKIPEKFRHMRCGYAHEEPAKEELAEMLKTTKELCSFLYEKIAEYRYAKENGDIDRELDLIIERNNVAKTRLEQLKEFTAKEIKIFNFKEIMEAIKSGKFNPVTGVLKVK